MPDLYQAWMTREVVDLEAEVVLADGLDVSYLQRFRAVYFGHDYDSVPVGMIHTMDRVGDGWKATFDLDGAHALARSVKAGVDAGSIRGVSIGFYAIDASPPAGKERDRWPDAETLIRRASLLELSVTPMPCCPGAEIVAVPKGKPRVGGLASVRRASAPIIGASKRRVVIV